jgi:hypothetical protein
MLKTRLFSLLLLAALLGALFAPVSQAEAGSEPYYPAGADGATTIQVNWNSGISNVNWNNGGADDSGVNNVNWNSGPR